MSVRRHCFASAIIFIQFFIILPQVLCFNVPVSVSLHQYKQPIHGISSHASTERDTIEITPSSTELSSDESPASLILLKHAQRQAEAITSSFQYIDFNPAPSIPLFRNNHFQTIAGTLWRDRSEFTYWDQNQKFPTALWKFWLDEGNESGVGLKWYDKRERLDTPDDDFFHVDYKCAPQNGSNSRGTVIILHGLESNSASMLVIDMARSYISRGFDVACKCPKEYKYIIFHLKFFIHCFISI